MEVGLHLIRTDTNSFLQKLKYKIMQINLDILWKRFKNIMYITIVLFLISLLFQKCESEKSLSTALRVSQQETIHFKNSLGKTTASHEVLVFQNKAQQKELIEKDVELKAMAKKFSEVKSSIKIITITKLDTIRESFDVPIPCDFERKGGIQNQWYNLGYKVNQNGLEIEPFQTWSDINVVTGFKKRWFLGRKYYTTDVTATNPYIEIPEVQSTQVEVPTKWYETTLFKVGLGIIGGILIAK